jgi:hypothetical protein
MPPRHDHIKQCFVNPRLPDLPTMRRYRMDGTHHLRRGPHLRILECVLFAVSSRVGNYHTDTLGEYGEEDGASGADTAEEEGPKAGAPGSGDEDRDEEEVCAA